MLPTLVSTVLVAYMLAACSTVSPETNTGPLYSTCTKASDLVVYPYSDSTEFKGYALARAGHVWFSAFGPVRRGKAEIVDFSAGIPTKVVIHTDSDLSDRVVLTGIECATGMALHFCYDQADNCGLTDRSHTPDELARQGTNQLNIAGSANDYTGYMLFPRPGNYQLFVRAAAHEVGSVTLSVAHSR